MPQQYTPFFSQMTANLGNAFMQSGQRERQQAQQAQMQQLTQGAYMGDPQAMAQLVAMNPQAAQQIQTMTRQRKQDELSQAAAQKSSKQETNQIITSALQEAAKFESIEDAQAFLDREIAANQGIIDTSKFQALTPETFGQIKEQFAPKGPSALDVARTEKVKAETKKLGAAGVSEADQLKIQELRLKIKDREEVTKARREKSAKVAREKDQSAIMGAFEARSAVESIDRLIQDGAYKDIYGAAEQFIPTIMPSSVDLEAARDQIISLLALENRKKLKGQGTISEGEANTLAKSGTILGQEGISEDTALEELKRVRNIFSRAERKAKDNPAVIRAFEEDAALSGAEGPQEIGSQSAYDALPSGAVYLEDGIEYRKP